MKFKVKDLSNNAIHSARKISEDLDGTVSVWSDTWQGRHVIGQDCEFVKNDITIEEFNTIRDLRVYLLRHPDREMVTASCLHFLGDDAQEWWYERH